MESARVTEIQNYLGSLPQRRQTHADGQIISELADLAHELLLKVLTLRATIDSITAGQPKSGSSISSDEAHVIEGSEVPTAPEKPTE